MVVEVNLEIRPLTCKLVIEVDHEWYSFPVVVTHKVQPSLEPDHRGTTNQSEREC